MNKANYPVSIVIIGIEYLNEMNETNIEIKKNE